MERVGAEMEWSRLHHKNSQAFVSTLANAHPRLDHRWMIQIHKCKEHTIMDFLDSVPLILLHNSVLETRYLCNSVQKINLIQKKIVQLFPQADVHQLFLCQNLWEGGLQTRWIGGMWLENKIGLDFH